MQENKALKLNDSNGKAIILNEEEKKLIMHIRGLFYGEMSIMVRDGKPIRIEEIKKSILLTEK